MSRKVLFNGSVLFRPGAATKIDASAFNSIALVGLGAVGLVGEADGGQPSIVKTFVSGVDAKTYYRSGPIVEAANILVNPSKDPRIPAGASSIIAVKVNPSTQSQYQSLTGINQSILFQSKDYGDYTNLFSIAITAGATTGRVLTLKDKSQTSLRTEVSPELGAIGKFTIRYTGSAASATLTTSATQLLLVTTGGVDDITINYSAIKTLFDVLARISANPNYTVVSLVANTQSFAPGNLDYSTVLDVKTATQTIYSRNYDIASWTNQFSSILAATRSTGSSNGATWPDVLAETPLTGAVRGTSTNTNWITAFATLATVDVQQVIPLASQDGSAYGNGDTYTFASIAASAEAHARTLSSTIGKSEREAWIGGALSKTNLIAQANALNSEHAVLVGQQPQIQFASDGSIGFGEEYLFATILAGMRAGAPIGEPLTWKFPNCISTQVRDSSWNPDNNTDALDLVNNGVMFARNVPQKGVRVERGFTTFIKLENDAYTEESVVQAWKLISRRLRAAVEDKYTGTKGLLSNINSIIPTLRSEAARLREEGAIADSLVNGAVVPGFRNAQLSFVNDTVSVSYIVSPVEGINFILNTVFLVPATVS